MKCEWWMEDPGPHPGCREFDPDPAIWECHKEAIASIYIDGDTYHLCSEHLRMETARYADHD